MNNNTGHEELARRLLEESPAAWPGELRALHIEQRKMPPALRAKLDQLTRTGTPQVNRKVVPLWRRPAVLALAAVVPVVLAIAVVVYFRGQAGKSGAHAILTYAEGRVNVGERRLHTGDRLLQAERLTTGAGSLAVVGIALERMETLIRVRPDSDLRFETLDNENVTALLDRGSVVVHFTPRKDAASRPRASSPVLSVLAPTAVCGVRGTEFSVEVDSQGDVRLTTYSGIVSFRRRWTELEDLPEEIFKKSVFLSDARQILTNAQSDVALGSQSTIKMDNFLGRVSRNTRLTAAFTDPAFARIRGQKSVSQADVLSALNVLEKAIPTEADRIAALEAVRAAFGKGPDVTDVDSNAIQEQRRALEAPGEHERAVRYEALKAQAQNMDKETYAREAARALGKAPQEVLLKTGETIYGSVFGENGGYRVYTPSGIRVVNPDEIEEIRF